MSKYEIHGDYNGSITIHYNRGNEDFYIYLDEYPELKNSILSAIGRFNQHRKIKWLS